MINLIRGPVRWIDSRTGFETAARRFLLEELPASTGWAQVFGSIALFLFLTQAFTGTMLAFNYAPTPGEAYSSVSYIIREVTAGKMMRGLHHWGASAMVVVVVLHMIQVFLYGAYKKPREMTWALGVLLLLFTLAFGLTGYLLPWDNRAYWGTMVTTRLMEQAPFAGAQLSQLLGAANGIGALTFARFYTLHTIILPGVMIFLTGVHVYLVRLHGIAGSRDNSGSEQRFYPAQAFRDAIAVFIAFLCLFALAAFIDAPLERVADPTDASYVPRPEWYFLFLFQTLKYFRGWAEPIGSIGLPTLAVIGLFAVPFLDRSQVQRLAQRTTAIAVILLAAVAWSALTAQAVASTPKSPRSPAEILNQRWSGFSPQNLAGVGYFRQAHCANCHNLFEGEPKPGPNLATLNTHKTADWMVEHFKAEDSGLSGGGATTAFSVARWNALSALALSLTPEAARILEETPDSLVQGAQVYVSNGCGNCHKVNQTGGRLGPPLNGVSARHSKDWIEKHFISPPALTPGSIMPPYRFSRADQDAIVSFLFSLPQ